MSEEEMMMNDDDSASETNESIDSEIKPTTSLAALENQVILIIIQHPSATRLWKMV